MNCSRGLFKLNYSALIIGLSLISSCGPVNPGSPDHLSTKSVEQSKKNRALQEDMVALFIQARAFDAAAPVAQKLYQEQKDQANPAYWMAVILREKGVYSEAEKYFLEAISKNSEHGPSYDGLGILYGIQGELKKALVAHQRASVLEPNNAKYWNNYGFALGLNKKFDLAIKAYEKSISLAPQEKRSFVNLAFIFGAQSKYKKAEHYLSQALPPAVVFYNLALIYEKKGKAKESLIYYQKAVQENSDFTQAQQAIERIKKK